jgi:hypothetical protein
MAVAQEEVAMIINATEAAADREVEEMKAAAASERAAHLEGLQHRQKRT